MTPRERLVSVFDGLDVEHSERYRVRDIDGDGSVNTFCNVMVSDACNALGVSLPLGFLARQQIHWLRSAPAHASGWRSCTESRAWQLAEDGYVVVVGWVNPDAKRSSHVALVHPAPPGNTGVWITQAGRTNYACAPLSRGFGANQPLEFYAARPATLEQPMPEIPLPPQFLPQIQPPPRDDDVPEPRPSMPTAPPLTTVMLETAKESGSLLPGSGGWTPKPITPIILGFIGAVCGALAVSLPPLLPSNNLGAILGAVCGAIAGACVFFGTKSAGPRVPTP